MTPQEQIKLAEWAQAGADKCAAAGGVAPMFFLEVGTHDLVCLPAGTLFDTEEGKELAAFVVRKLASKTGARAVVQVSEIWLRIGDASTVDNAPRESRLMVVVQAPGLPPIVRMAPCEDRGRRTGPWEDLSGIDGMKFAGRFLSFFEEVN